jgi:hypothetical protein
MIRKKPTHETCDNIPVGVGRKDSSGKLSYTSRHIVNGDCVDVVGTELGAYDGQIFLKIKLPAGTSSSSTPAFGFVPYRYFENIDSGIFGDEAGHVDLTYVQNSTGKEPYCVVCL